MIERLAREKTLNPLAHYVGEKPAETVDVASAMRDWAKQNDARFKARVPKQIDVGAVGCESETGGDGLVEP